LLHRAGVPILAGTDVAHPRAVHGLSLHAELTGVWRQGERLDREAYRTRIGGTG
jgi:hypothetical protein